MCPVAFSKVQYIPSKSTLLKKHPSKWILLIEKAVGTGLNKSLPTEIIESDNITNREHDVEKDKLGKDDTNVTKSIHDDTKVIKSNHRKQTYTQIVAGGIMRVDKLNSPNVMSGEK